MKPILLNIAEPVVNYKGPAVFASGHRVMFLLCGLWAVLGLGIWLAALHGAISLESSWHGHEMIFGFATAAIGGFLMAAVPKWTRAIPYQGMSVALLGAAWVLGRLGMVVGGDWAFLDLLYLPLLASMIALMIFRAKNSRNYQVVVIVSALFAVNLYFHFGDPKQALRIGVLLVIAMASLIGGRIIPAFTQNALRMKYGMSLTCETPALIEKMVIAGILGTILSEVFVPHSLISGLASLTVGVLLCARMVGWNSLKTFYDPILWILHVAYVWLPLGFIFKGLNEAFGLLSPDMALHAHTTGAIGLLILAVASRAALGHSGRPLKVRLLTVLAYYLVIAGAVARVFLGDLTMAASLGGTLWTLGYLLFTIDYAPLLVQKRIDGLPG